MTAAEREQKSDLWRAEMRAAALRWRAAKPGKRQKAIFEAICYRDAHRNISNPFHFKFQNSPLHEREKST